MRNNVITYVQRNTGRTEKFHGAEFRISTNGVLCVFRKGEPNSLIRAYPEGTWIGASDSPIECC